MLALCSVILFAFFSIGSVAQSGANWPAGWSYIGCMFEDHKGHLLGNGDYTRSDKMTNGMCIARCIGLGATYAGTMFSEQCFCGSSLDRNIQGNTEVDCRSMCAGDNIERCGGGTEYMTLWRYIKPPPAAPVPSSTRPPPPAAVPSSTTARPNPSTSQPAPANPPADPPAVSSRPGADVPQPSAQFNTPQTSSYTPSSIAPSTPPIEITQYLPPAISASISTVPAQNASSGSGLETGSRVNSASGLPAPTPDSRFENVTVIRVQPGSTTPPRLKDQSNMIVFGTYINGESHSRAAVNGRTLGTIGGAVLVSWAVVFAW